MRTAQKTMILRFENNGYIRTLRKSSFFICIWQTTFWRFPWTSSDLNHGHLGNQTWISSNSDWPPLQDVPFELLNGPGLADLYSSFNKHVLFSSTPLHYSAAYRFYTHLFVLNSGFVIFFQLIASNNDEVVEVVTSPSKSFHSGFHSSVSVVEEVHGGTVVLPSKKG